MSPIALLAGLAAAIVVPRAADITRSVWWRRAGLTIALAALVMWDKWHGWTGPAVVLGLGFISAVFLLDWIVWATAVLLPVGVVGYVYGDSTQHAWDVV